MQPLARLRLQLTLWYVGIFVSILALLGGGVFLAARHRISGQLDASLRGATAALIEAARIREAERTGAKGVVADAIDELHIPDRALYLFDAAGRPIKPAQAAAWIADAAREAARTGRADRDLDTPDDHTVRLHAERFTGAGGTVYVAAAAADRLELEDEYASLIRALVIATLVALLLVAGGGYVLVHQSTSPIERSMEQMRRFMADAAHELRTPITLLRTRAEVARGEERDPVRDAATLQTIERETARLGVIVGELLTLAQADAGQRAVAREPLYLDDAAAGAVDAARPLAEHKRVAVEVGTFEEAKINGDPALVRQLLVIVLDNAIKFTPAGGRVRLDVSAQDGTAVVVVTDTGIGIPADQVPHVFERFYRGDAARRAADGAGLGLAIARWIADVHGAHLELTSQPDAGTRVAIHFPLAL
ncbi:MAG TPA: HAMP domain-containing sensor histidine kinase [Gemmatimonadales bacterium]|jgi:signal transduction histidine kinase|nr:HAMP domain-containing sensor histidine kinase [Gemmatimonadales bacterium]